MKKNNKSHKRIATFFLLIFLPTLFPTSLFASNNGPMAPEAASFEPVDATDMVNLVTGDMSYNLPVLNVPSPEGGYPLALSYHGGVALGQEASWVGLGWNINPGAMNRNVNNTPDDWNNAKSIEFVYSDLGTNDIVSVGLGMRYKVLNIGLDYTFVNGKGVGGVVSLSSSVGNSGMSTKLGFGAYSAATGGSGNIGILSFSTQNGIGLSVTPSSGFVSSSINFSSTGISFSGTSNRISYGVGIGFSSGSNTMAHNVHSITKSFNVSLPLPHGLNLRLGFSKVKYSMLDVRTSNTNGTLYLKDSYLMYDLNSKKNIKTSVMDATETKAVFYDPADPRNDTPLNPAFPSYDNYSASGQGIMQSIQPLLLESKTLVMAGSEDNTYVTRYHVGPQFTNKFMEDINPDNNKSHFYALNTNSSFIDKSLTNWTYAGTLNSITNILNSDVTNTTLNDGSTTYSNYNATKNRLKKETFVETFTNEQINNNPSLIFEAEHFNRNSVSTLVPKGIGAFRVTALDGKVYHYSLPVYNYEVFMRSYSTERGEDKKFIEKINAQPFATHWLLTAITGPDYVDTDSDGKPDNNDYGYWVNFDYGKWTDSYVWKKESLNDKEVSTEYNSCSNPDFNYNKSPETTSSRILGVKQIYYLNSINTRTHSALFIKSIKNDDKGNSIAKANVYNDVNASVVFDTALADGVYFTNTDYNYNVNISGAVPTLKLDRIALVKKADKVLFPLSSQQTAENPTSNSINIKSTGIMSNVLGQNLGSVTTTLAKRTWTGGTFSNNMYLQSTINPTLLDQKALSSTKFDYDNSLAKSGTAGKLTLKSVTTYGKNNTNVIPPYVFEYYNTRDYNKDNYDLWGYDKNYPYNYSLKKITTPLGSSINVEYEKDDFTSVLNDLHPASTIESIKPTIKKFVRNTDGWGGAFEFIWSNPCYSIGQIYSCLEPGRQVNLTFKKDSQPSVTVIANIISVNGNTVNMNFIGQIPSYFNGDFYCCAGKQCPYTIDINYGGCTANNELLGKCDDSRGGLRVKNISVMDNDNTYVTNYNYNNPNTTTSSGITASTPYIENDYASMFSPGVMYEYVTVSSKDKNGNTEDKTLYQFDVLKPQIDYQRTSGTSPTPFVNISAQYGHFYKITGKSELTPTLDILADHATTKNYYMSNTKLYSSQITDNTAKLGSLISVTKLNSNDHILNKKTFNYLDSFIDSFGTYSESFEYFKSRRRDNAVNINNQAATSYEYTVNSSKKKVIPSLLLSETTMESGRSNTVYYDKYDFLTGQITETRTINSNGLAFKNKTVPAYVKYGEMGSKVDNPSNKNMLTQTTASYSYMLNNGSWKETGVGITTWNNKWTYKDIGGNTITPTTSKENVWRKHKLYVWNGTIDNEGVFTNFNSTNDDGFDWTGIGIMPSQWKLISEISLYDRYSMALESKDINGNFATNKMGDNNTKIMTSGNAAYTEMFYAGAENITDSYWLEPEVRLDKGSRTTTYAHTGKYSTQTNNTTEFGVFMRGGQHRAGRYKLTVWVQKANASKARIHLGGGSGAIEFNGESYVAGDWILKTHYFDVPLADFYPYLNSSDNSPVYYDDLMIRPISSSISGYVYNEWDELTYIIANNGLATKFEYDNAGSLAKTYTEVVEYKDNNGAYNTGGFKLKSENIIKYRNK